MDNAAKKKIMEKNEKYNKEIECSWFIISIAM